MVKKWIYVVSVLVLLGPTNSVSADLVAHWTFNDDGTDSIGSAHCSLQNGAAYSTDSREGSHSLSLDGIDDYAIPTASTVLYDPFRQETVALWFKANFTGGTQVIYDEGGWTNGLSLRINADTLQAAVRIGENQVTASTGFASVEWTHAAVTFDNGLLRLYVNGAERASATTGFSTVPSHTNASGIGARNAQDAFGGGDFVGDYFSGLIDDVQIYDNALFADDIEALVAGIPRILARDPSPVDGAIHPRNWVSLSWTPGADGVSHDVYLGELFDDVANGTGDTFRGNRATAGLLVGVAESPYPNGLLPGVRYYWRIDEVEAGGTTKHKGDIWSFTISPRTAYAPDPPDGARFINTDVTLSWTPGFGAALHFVYLGENRTDVEAGTGGTAKGPFAGPSYAPGALARDTTYYWRIDQFDGSATHQGETWRFRTIPEIAMTEPNLVGWWKLDRNFGAIALDWSGDGHDGVLQNDPQWVAGYDGAALELNGDDWVSIDGYQGILGGGAFSITAWIWAANNGEIVGWGQPTNGQRVEFRINAGVLRCENGGGSRYLLGRTEVRDLQWHHVAVTVNESASIAYPDVILYLDGEDDTVAGGHDQVFDLVANYDVTIGQRYNRSNARWFSGFIDDVRIYDKVLTRDQIKEVMRIDPRLAWDPRPANGSRPDIEGAMRLAWSEGDQAAQHDVYFGTDALAVEAADASDTTGVYQGRQSTTSYPLAGALASGTGPYYWRIDEIDQAGTIRIGRIWSFSVADYLIVDDFESYNDIDPPDPESYRLFEVWSDGYETPTTNGALVGNDVPPYAEIRTAYVHSGAKAMPLSFDNDGKYSEVTMSLTGTASDWTRQGVAELSLWFRGESTNAAEPMYVALNDIAVYHDNPDAVQIGAYEEWVIPLQTFADQGVSLNNVTRMAIGFGTPGSTAAGGTGTIYVDDIRLYRSRTP